MVVRGEIWMVNLDPTVGSEIKKSRPCAVISPSEMHGHLRTVIVAPMTTKGNPYPTRIVCRFAGTNGQIALDQIRTVDQVRLTKRLGRIGNKTSTHVLDVLKEMFAP